MCADAFACMFVHIDPLFQTPTHPGVTFYDKPVEKQFTSSGGHVDFDNGVTMSVPASSVSAGATGLVSVQPCLAPRGVFVLPEGVVSASPSYLISGEGISGEVTLDMEHHVQVNSREEANELSFLEADSSPTRSCDSEPVYRYKEVPKNRAEFTPGENKGKLKVVTQLKKFFKIGLKSKLGMYLFVCIYLYIYNNIARSFFLVSVCVVAIFN